MKIVVLSPHRDDVAFSLGLVIELWLSAGHVVEVVNCFTCSEYAPFSDVNLAHSNDQLRLVTELRRREDEAWCSFYNPGLTLVDLRLMDGPLRLACSAEEVCNLIPDHTEKGYIQMREAISCIRADAFVLPLAIGAHVDHSTVRDAALASITRSTACAFYEDLPYAARPDMADTIVKAVEELAKASSMTLVQDFAVEPQDVEAAVARKYRLALCYQSQISDETAYQIAQFCRPYEGRERLWVNAIWGRQVRQKQHAA